MKATIVSILAAMAASVAGTASASAADPYIIGITGDLSGTSSGTYKPLAEGVRLYFEALNAKGGIDGHPVQLLTRDNRSDPNEVVGDLSFFDSQKTVANVLTAPSGTLGAYVRQNKTAQIPTFYVNACYPPATPPQPDANFFCPGISTLADTFAFIETIRTLMKEGEGGKDKFKLGIVTTDIPGARAAAEKIMKPYAEKLGLEVEVAVMPVTSSDATSIARSFMDKGIDAVVSWTISKHMVAGAEALTKLGWKGKYLLATILPGTMDQLQALKNPNIYGLDHFALVADGTPVMQDLRAAVTNQSFDFPLDDLRMGYRSSMVLSAALQRCGWPCDRDKLRDVLQHLNDDDPKLVQLNLDPVVFSPTNHTSPEKHYRVYHWAADKNAVVDAGVRTQQTERDWK